MSSTGGLSLPPSPTIASSVIQKGPSQKTKGKSSTKEPKVRKTPACDHCRAKKIACHHRSKIDEHGNIIEGPEEEPKEVSSEPAAGQTTTNVDGNPDAATTRHSEIAGSENEKASETVLQRPRRAGAGKRKFDDYSNEDAAGTESKRARTVTRASSAKPQERKKPGRKPRQKTPIVIPETPSVSSPDAERSASPPREFQQLPISDNMAMSIDMAWHRHMTAQLDKKIKDTAQKWALLQEIIETAQTQWDDVVNSMESTKTLMNEWTSRFTRNNAYMG